MSARGEALAAQFEQANRLLAQTIEGMTDKQWAALCPAEGWSVGTTAHHIATNHLVALDLIQRAAAGETLPPISVEQMNEDSAEHARRHAACTRVETLALLQQANTTCAIAIRAFTDEQLQRTVPLPRGAMSVVEIIEQIMTGHVEGEHGHFESMRRAAATEQTLPR